MKKYNFLTNLIAVTLALLFIGLPSQTWAQDSAGGENFIFINYIGQEMTFDLDDVTYRIPGTDMAPEGGRLALQLPEGEHKFAANIPAVAGTAGEFTIPPGGYVAKAARLEKTNPVLANDGTILEKPRDYVFVFDFDPFAAPVEPAPVVDTWQPAAAAPGQSSLVFTNYTRDELTVDLNGQLYKVPAPTNNIPGRVQLSITPGDYRYTASIPGGSLNADITVMPGQVIGLNITADLPPEREYVVGEKYDFLLPVTLHLFEEDLTARANAAMAPAAPVAAPAALPASGSEAAPAPQDQTAPAFEGLRIKNYAGETLIFTINNQAYTVPNNDELTIPLPPGSYNYTASRPFVATTGTVELQPSQPVELSIAINVAGDVLSAYQN
jgi:hypothetical protein